MGSNHSFVQKVTYLKMLIHSIFLYFLASFIEASEQPYKFWRPSEAIDNYHHAYQEIRDRKLDTRNKYNHVDNYYDNSYYGHGYDKNTEYDNQYHSQYENQYNRNGYDVNSYGNDANSYNGYYGYNNYDYVDYPVHKYSSSPVMRILQQMIQTAKNKVENLKGSFYNAIDRQFGPGGIPPALIVVGATTAVATGGVLVTTGVADQIIDAITDFIDPTTTTTAAPTKAPTTTTTPASIATGTSTAGPSGRQFWF